MAMPRSFGDTQLTNLRRSVAKKLTGSQLVLTFLQNPVVHYCVHKILLLTRILMEATNLMLFTFFIFSKMHYAS